MTRWIKWKIKTHLPYISVEMSKCVAHPTDGDGAGCGTWVMSIYWDNLALASS